MSETNALPTQRPLKRPYFLLRTSDGRNHYFRYEIVRAIFHSSDPLTRFLPRAEVVGKPDARTQTDSQEPALVYDFSELEIEDPAPLEYLSDAEIESFAQAVEAFLLRSQNAPAVSSYERELREHFRLPDPVKESEAYWTYGPKKDRKLLILHGVEYEPDTSVSLDVVVRHLQNCCRLPWGLAQERVIERVLETGEPISQYIARPAANGYLVGGRLIPKDAVKPIKRFPKKVTAAFLDAAADFYSRAHPERAASASEAEWRSQFKLPDPKKNPGAFFMSKHESHQGLFIVLSEHEREDNCLPLCADPKIPATMGGENLADRMASLKPSILVMVGGIAAAVAVVGLAGTWVANRDTTGPFIDEDFADKGVLALDTDHPDDPLKVLIQFNEAIDPASLLTEAGESKLVLRDDRTDVQLPLKSTPEVVGELKNQILLTLSKPMSEGSDYRLEIAPIADLKGNLSEELDADFEFADELVPALHANKLPTAEGNAFNQVRFFFTDDLEERSVQDARNYYIEPIALPGSDAKIMTPLKITNARINEDRRSVTIHVDAIDTPFEEGREYRATISGIEDTAGNEVDDDEALEISFSYIDTLPPSPTEVVADGTQFALEIHFDERINPDIARIGNYITIKDKDGNPVDIQRARVNEAGDILEIETKSALRSSIEYTAHIREIPDAANNPNVMLGESSLPFTYRGVADLDSPRLVKATALLGKLTLEYSEEIDPRATSRDTFSRFTLEDEFGKKYTVSKAEIREKAPNKLRLTPSGNIPDDILLTIETPGITDFARNPGTLDDLRMTFASGTMVGPIKLDQAVYEPGTELVRIKFNRRPSKEILKHTDWFNFTPGLVIKELEFSPEDSKQILLKVEGMVPDVEYTLMLGQDVTALDGSSPSSVLQTRFKGPSSQTVSE